MKKPQALREYLLKSLPNLSSDEDRLLIFANQGTCRSTLSGNFSFEMTYTLDIIITDYAGDVDEVSLVLFTWLAENQSELLANIEKGKQAINFEAELIDNKKYDINFQIQLTERVVVKKLADGRLEMSYPGEPELKTFDPPQTISIRNSQDEELATVTTKEQSGFIFDMPPTGKNP